MTDDLTNLAKHVRSRREARDWTQLDVQAQGGPSNSTLTAIEAARPPAPRRTTMRKLDEGLQWEPGSAKRVLAGGTPTPLEDMAAKAAQPSTEAPTPGLLYRRPPGLSDQEWERVEQQTRSYHEYLISQVRAEQP